MERKRSNPRIGPAFWITLYRWEFLMIDLLFNIIGMSGTFLIVGAFIMLQLEKLNPKSLAYNLTNLFGAILLLISLCYNFNLASFVIELFWIAASLIGLVKYYTRSPETVITD
jgi:uncharacterized membrane protein YesL